MYIRIINGTYGHRQLDRFKRPSLTVEPKTRYDPPFEVPVETAQRLVALGIAAIAEETPAPPAEQAAPAAENARAGSEAAKAKKPTAAKETAKNATQKKNAKQASEAMPAEDGDPEEMAVEDGEQMPDLGAEAPVL